MPFKPRGDRVVAIATQRRQQATMAKVAHAALKEYIRHVRAAVGHTAIRAAADPNQPEHPDVDLNALDQSVVWPAILKRTILPEIDKIILGLGPQKHMTPAVVSSVNAWRAQWMAARTQRLVGVPASITKQIRDAIQEAADLNGPDPSEAADIVKSLLNPDAPTWASRAMTIARTEVVSSNNQGGLASWTAVHQSLAPSGGQVFKTWLATSDSKTRPEHAEIDGTEIPISQTFTVGGQEMTGPGDESADADEVINCRCTLTYRVDDGTGAGADIDDADAIDDGDLTDAADEGVDEAEDAEDGTGDVETDTSGDLDSGELSADEQDIADAPEGDSAFDILGQNRPDLDSEEAGRVQYYTGDGFSQLNQRLADGTADSADLNAADALDGIIGQSPAAGDAIVYRGLSTGDAAVGDLITNDGFVSTTTSQSIAKTYAGVDTNRAMLRILVPEGNPALALDKSLSNNPHEKEVLLPKGTNFRIVGKSTVKGQYGLDTSMYDVVIDKGAVVSSALAAEFLSALRRVGADAAGDDGADEGLTAATEVPVTAPAVTAPPQIDGTPSEAVVPAATPGAMQWSGPILPLDVPSPDGRMFLSSGMTVRELPLPISYQAEGTHGGEEAGKTVVVGRQLTSTTTGGMLAGTGDFFDPMTNLSPTAAIEQVAAGIGFVSANIAVKVMSYVAPGPDGALIPIDPMQYMGDPMGVVCVAEEWEYMGCCIVDQPAFGQARIEIVLSPSMPDLGPVVADAATPEGPILTPDAVTFPDGTVLKVGDQVNVVGAMGADTPSTGLIESINPDTNEVTVAVEDPASPGKTDSVTVDASSLDVVDDGTDDTTAPADDTAGLTAALAFPGLEQEHVYPAEWFSLPDLDDIDHQPHLRVTEEGQVLGLLAQSGSCHIGFANECVAPPTSPANYAYFHVGEVKTDQGFLPVGKVTVGGGHADLKLGYRGATEHYDNAGAAAAVLRAYDTQIGVVVAGALLPQATPEQIAALRRNDLSGDWRPIGGNRELVAALSVNTGGFPLTPRAALAADGRPMALVAAGVVHGTEPRPGVELPSGVKLSAEDVAVLASAFAEVSVKQQADMKHAQRRAAEARALRTNLIRTKLHSVS